MRRHSSNTTTTTLIGLLGNASANRLSIIQPPVATQQQPQQQMETEYPPRVETFHTALELIPYQQQQQRTSNGSASPRDDNHDCVELKKRQRDVVKFTIEVDSTL